MARPEKMPDVVFIGPTKRRAKFSYVVFQVLSRDAKGIVRDLKLIQPHETVELEGGEDFMTGYIPHHMTKPDSKYAPK